MVTMSIKITVMLSTTNFRPGNTFNIHKTNIGHMQWLFIYEYIWRLESITVCLGAHVYWVILYFGDV
jgi:hypothetical protein